MNKPKVFRVVSMVLGLLLAAAYLFSCIVYWGNLYGAIGVFGSMITLPLSVSVVTFIWLFLTSWASAIITLLWIGVVVLLLLYSEIF